jgi:hypothetical protein
MLGKFIKLFHMKFITHLLCVSQAYLPQSKWSRGALLFEEIARNLWGADEEKWW